MGSPAMYVGSGRNNGLVLAMDDRAAVMTRYSVWKALSGFATDIAVGGSQPTSPVIWVTSGNNTVWSLVNNTPVQDPNGNGSAIAVTKAGVPWAVTSSNTVKRRANATCNTGTNACNGTWTQVGSGARDIAIGSSSVWIISNTATSGGNFAVQTWNGTLTGDGTFVAPSAPMDGVRITVMGNTPCVVKRGTNAVGGSVFCKSSNSTWSELKTGTCAADIGAGFFNGGIYAVDCNNGSGGNHGVWIWNSNQATNPNTQFGNIDFGPTTAASQWVNFDGLAARIAVGPDGRPYAVQATSGGIFRRDPR